MPHEIFLRRFDATAASCREAPVCAARRLAPRRLTRSLYASLLVLALAAAPARAQESGRVSGTIRDETGAALTGVVGTVASPDSPSSRRTTTDGSGYFVFTDLPPSASYRLSATHPDFQPFRTDRFSLDAGQIVTRDVRLTRALAVQLHVSAPSPADRSAIAQVIEETLVRDLPVADRGFLPLTALAPGFTGRPDFPDTQGQHYWSNNVVVDGASDFSKWRGAPRSFSSGYARESIRDVTVFPQLFPASFGGALGSVTMATTRAGGDMWRGSAFGFGRHSALAAPPVFATDKPSGATAQYGATIGGPLASRTFLFASYDARRAREHNVVSSPAADGVTVPTDQDERIAFARVDHSISATQSIAARMNLQFLRWHDEPGALTLPGSGTDFTNDAHTILVTHNAQLTEALTHELRVQFSHYVDRREDLLPDVYVSRNGYSIEGGLLGPAGLGVSPEHAWEAHESLRRQLGSHTLRFGGSASLVDSHATGSPYGHGAYFFAGGPAAAPQPYLYMQGVAESSTATAADARDVSAGAFVEDEWRASGHVTITAGVRYDVEQIRRVRNFTASTDTNNFQPRLAVAWAPDGGQTVLRAAAGMYSQQHILYPIVQVQLQGVDGLATIALDRASPTFPTFPAVLPPAIAIAAAPRDVYRVGSDFRNAYSLQTGAGIEQRVRGLSVSADYMRLDGFDLMSIVDANAPASLVKPGQRTVAEADATRPLSPSSGYRKLLTLGNVGRSWYRALQLKAVGGPQSVRFVGAYTFAHADDQANYELPEDSRNLDAEHGRAPTDIRHNASGALTWQIPGERLLTRGWALATVMVLRSGRPYTMTWGDDRNGTTQNDARPGARNTIETGPYRVVDLSLAKHGTVGRARVEARLELFNLFNTVNYDEYVGSLQSPLFGQPISAFPRRRLQLALVVRY